MFCCERSCRHVIPDNDGWPLRFFPLDSNLSAHDLGSLRYLYLDLSKFPPSFPGPKRSPGSPHLFSLLRGLRRRRAPCTSQRSLPWRRRRMAGRHPWVRQIMCIIYPPVSSNMVCWTVVPFIADFHVKDSFYKRFSSQPCLITRGRRVYLTCEKNHGIQRRQMLEMI